jgi:hypothetical protein
MVVERLEAKVGGQAQKRGLIPRTPAGERVLADVATWLTAEYSDAVRSTHSRTTPTGEHELAIDLHPAAAPLLLVATEGGRVSVAGETAPTGPGYHRFVGRLLERMATEVGVEWTEGDGATTFLDRPAAERAYLAWLGPQLTRARVAVQRGERAVHLGLPAGTRYTVDEALVTVLGPRSEAWLESAIADPRTALEITPWWSDATDGRYLLNRALASMWTDVRWRAPAMEAEGELMDEVHRRLSRAFPMDPGLPYPWRAWSELAKLRRIDDAMARQAIGRAAAGPEPSTPIGYRRQPVRITHEGWLLTVPGSWAERRSPEEWWGGGVGRSITLAATRTGGASGGTMSAEDFIDQFAVDLGRDALTHRAGEVVGRGRLTTDPTSGVEVGVLDGYAAIRGSGAAIRIEFNDPADWEWAVDTWRALTPG